MKMRTSIHPGARRASLALASVLLGIMCMCALFPAEIAWTAQTEHAIIVSPEGQSAIRTIGDAITKAEPVINRRRIHDSRAS
jgi:hypothetical protein